jgi:uncharacterized membrane protein YoaK (UPF0700 family)
MSASASSITGRRRTTILLFTVAAGSIDAIVYLAAHVFTANMTGNAVLFGIAAGQGKALVAVNSVIALVAFTAGLVLGTVLVPRHGKSTKWTFVRNAVLAEAALLALFAAMFLLPRHLGALERYTVLLIIISSGLAMGLQSAVVRRLNLPGIATTYITGTMTSLVSGLTHHWRHQPETEAEFEERRESWAGMRLQAEVFLAYALAAVACGALYLRWPAVLALLPLVSIGVVTAYMFVRHHQIERGEIKRSATF